MKATAAGWAVALALLLGAPVADAIGAPLIGPAWTSGVGTTSATLNAEINPNGLATGYHFSYLSEAAYQGNLSVGKDGFAGAARVPVGADQGIGSGSTAVLVPPKLVGSLTPDTAYRYRAEASYGDEAVIGPGRVFSTEAFAGAPLLLDNRGWEMVSPVDKNGGEIQGFGQSFGGGVIQASVGGGAITYSSTSSFGDGAGGAPAGSQYAARRGGGAWASANVTVPTVAGAYGAEPDGVPYQLFSPDLERALLFDGRACGGVGDCPVGYSLRDGAGALLATSPARADLHFAGASGDLRHIVLSTCAALSAEATEVPGSDGCDPGEPNLYEWSEGQLRLLNLLPGDGQGTPGATLAAQSGAVSDDGARVYFTLGGNLYLREGGATKQVAGGGGRFETAAVSGSPAFYTAGGHLYSYDPAGIGTSIDLADGVEGVLGASENGDYVYYATAAGLFLRHDGAPTEVAAGPGAAEVGSYPPATGSARVTPDGTHLAFLSKASLTGYDDRKRTLPGLPPGPPQTEVFLYDATTANLTCASCNPTGEQPLGPSTLTGASANGTLPATATSSYKPRNLSADGRRLFFDSADNLALQDNDTSPPSPDADVYEWEAQGAGSCGRAGGCLNLISSGRNSEGSSFLDASASGADAFFLTRDSLVTADSSFADVYDAREGGGFPEQPRPLECVGDACQFLPSEPEDPTPGTLVPSVGNGPVRFAKPLRPGCRKGFVRKKGKCVKKARHHRKKSRQHQRRKSSSQRDSAWRVRR